MKPYFAFSQAQKPVMEASAKRTGWPFTSAKVCIPASGWAISTWGSLCIVAMTAFAGAFAAARFRTMKLLEPIPMSMELVASSCGTFTDGPPWIMVTSRPRFRYSPVASAS